MIRSAHPVDFAKKYIHYVQNEQFMFKILLAIHYIEEVSNCLCIYIYPIKLILSGIYDECAKMNDSDHYCGSQVDPEKRSLRGVWWIEVWRGA